MDKNEKLENIGKNGQNQTKMKIGQNCKLDKMEKWTKWKNGLPYLLD